MLLGEPPRSQGDLNFVLFGFPVRVHPFFWLIALLLGLGGSNEPVSVLIWVVAVFISILVHELGHAFAIRRFGGQVWITLYGMGGLASSNAVNRTSKAQILISAAGPAAGFAFAGLVLLAILSAGHDVSFVRSLVPVRFEGFAAQRLNILIWDLLFINILWGMLNLLPVYPLDGGQIAREVLLQQNPGKGIVQSLWLSVFTAACLAAFALSRQSIYMALMFGYLAYSSYTTIQAYAGRGGGQRW